MLTFVAIPHLTQPAAMVGKTYTKKRGKNDRGARASAFYKDISVLAKQEEAPPLLTTEDIKRLMIPPELQSVSLHHTGSIPQACD
jgi:hypothetical protein